MWTYVGDDTQPFTFFGFTRSRERDGPARVLAHFRGYDVVSLDSHGAIVEVACWVPARRKFFESRDSDSQRANIALTRIRQLHEIERRVQEQVAGDWRDLPLAERAAQIAGLPQQQGAADSGRVPHLARQAIHTGLAQEPDHGRDPHASCRSTDDGQLAIDNNAAERTLRGLAIGRKNWLLVGSQQGGHTAATILTLITSASRHHLDPFAYLRDLLRRLPTTAPEDLADLLPVRWQPA